MASRIVVGSVLDVLIIDFSANIILLYAYERFVGVRVCECMLRNDERIEHIQLHMCVCRRYAVKRCENVIIWQWMPSQWIFWIEQSNVIMLLIQPRQVETTRD